MNGNVTTAFAAALAASALTLAQDVFPGLLFYHTWQYALALALAIVIVVAYTYRERRYRLAVLGVVAIGAAGLWSGLTGADTATLTRGPGQIVHAVPGAVVRFPIADAQTVRAGDARLDVIGRGTLRPGEREFVDSSVLVAQTRPAAYIDATDLRDRHLTVTQPEGNTFLSPVLLFPTTAKLRNKSYPIDLFALPGVGKQVQAFYFSPRDLSEISRADLPPGKPALLVALTDDRHNLIPGGITFVPDGVPTDVAGVRLDASLGRYPVLLVASAPWPPALIGGGGLALVGLLVRWRRALGRVAADQAGG